MALRYWIKYDLGHPGRMDRYYIMEMRSNGRSEAVADCYDENVADFIAAACNIYTEITELSPQAIVGGPVVRDQEES